jgi:uncharacterized membrane protein
MGPGDNERVFAPLPGRRGEHSLGIALEPEDGSGDGKGSIRYVAASCVIRLPTVFVRDDCRMPAGDQLSLGERSADRMRNMMGSWPFVFSFFAIMIAWAIVNTLLFEHVLHHKAFDPYPYILLNLFLSMLAGVQAAALLIAAKRADAISSEVAIHTANNTDDIKTLISENTALTSRVKKNTDLLEEIHLHVANIGKRVGADMGNFPPGGAPPTSSDRT